jgi:REP element-mobilizing transposase RayT
MRDCTRRVGVQSMSNDLLAYFITFRTYGTWLPGDDRGSTDMSHIGWNEPHLVPDAHRRSMAHSRLVIAPVTLSRDQRSTVKRAISEQCRFRGWQLHAINVRKEHVHLVVGTSIPPERVLTMLKAYATRALRDAGAWAHRTSPWSRHGSTVYVWSDESLAEVCRYVMLRQNSSGRAGAGTPLPRGRGTERGPRPFAGRRLL